MRAKMASSAGLVSLLTGLLRLCDEDAIDVEVAQFLLDSLRDAPESGNCAELLCTFVPAFARISGAGPGDRIVRAVLEYVATGVVECARDNDDEESAPSTCSSGAALPFASAPKKNDESAPPAGSSSAPLPSASAPKTSAPLSSLSTFLPSAASTVIVFADEEEEEWTEPHTKGVGSVNGVGVVGRAASSRSATSSSKGGSMSFGSKRGSDDPHAAAPPPSSSPSSELSTLLALSPFAMSSEDAALLLRAKFRGSAQAFANWLLEETPEKAESVAEDIAFFRRTTTASAAADDGARASGGAGGGDDADVAALRETIRRFGQVPDRGPSASSSAIGHKSVAAAPCADGGGKGGGKGGKVVRYVEGKEVWIAANQKYIVEDLSPKPDPSTFVSIKLKKKGQGGASPGWS